MICALRSTAIIVALVGALLVGSTVMADHTAARLKTLLAGFRFEYGFPGATAAIVFPDGGVSLAATGLADVAADLVMTSDTRMLGASIAKSFVAMTALALESDGVLSGSNILSRHLGAPGWFIRLANHATMTVGDLQRHTSGLPDHVHLESFQSELAARKARGAAAFTPEAAIAFLPGTEPLFSAGHVWAYSDTGYLLPGLLIEKASGVLRPCSRAFSDASRLAGHNPVGHAQFAGPARRLCGQR